MYLFLREIQALNTVEYYRPSQERESKFRKMSEHQN